MTQRRTAVPVPKANLVNHASGCTMDDLVIRGMAKWPDVPAVYGWLALDRRGSWLLKGEKISNPTVNAFIGRNYAHDEQGRWFFQNGPQRVYVALEYAPFVYRVHRAGNRLLEVEAHTGQRARSVLAAWLDENGAVLLQTDLGVGMVHDRDLDVVTSALVDAHGEQLDDETLEERIHRVQRGDETALYLHLGGTQSALPMRGIQSADVAHHFGFDANPSDTVAQSRTETQRP